MQKIARHTLFRHITHITDIWATVNLPRVRHGGLEIQLTSFVSFSIFYCYPSLPLPALHPSDQLSGNKKYLLEDIHNILVDILGVIDDSFSTALPSMVVLSVKTVPEVGKLAVKHHLISPYLHAIAVTYSMNLSPRPISFPLMLATAHWTAERLFWIDTSWNNIADNFVSSRQQGSSKHWCLTKMNAV